jgi:hypothetical protein
VPFSQAAVLINAPAELVFPALASFVWAEDFSQIERADQSVRPGSALTTKTRWLGRCFNIVMLVEASNPPSRLIVTSVGGKPIAFRGVYSLTEQNDRTLVEMSVEIRLAHSLRPLSILAKRAADRRLRLGSDRLKELLEATGDQSRSSLNLTGLESAGTPSNTTR